MNLLGGSNPIDILVQGHRNIAGSLHQSGIADSLHQLSNLNSSSHNNTWDFHAHFVQFYFFF